MPFRALLGGSQKSQCLSKCSISCSWCHTKQMTFFTLKCFCQLSAIPSYQTFKVLFLYLFLEGICSLFGWGFACYTQCCRDRQGKQVHAETRKDSKKGPTHKTTDWGWPLEYFFKYVGHISFCIFAWIPVLPFLRWQRRDWSVFW